METYLKFCSHGAIKIEKDGKVKIDKNKCRDCGKCKESCPFNAIAEKN